MRRCTHQVVQSNVNQSVVVGLWSKLSPERAIWAESTCCTKGEKFITNTNTKMIFIILNWQNEGVQKYEQSRNECITRQTPLKTITRGMCLPTWRFRQRAAINSDPPPKFPLEVKYITDDQRGNTSINNVRLLPSPKALGQDVLRPKGSRLRAVGLGATGGNSDLLQRLVMR